MQYIITIILLLCLPCVSYAADLTACGTINAAGSYVLQNNVTSNGTCFTITANDVTLDLNGKTVTYDNAAPLAVTNGSFESALTGNWDVSGAANAARVSGAYLTPSVYAGTYALNVTTPTADQVIQTVGTVTLAANTTYSLSGMVFNQVADDIVLTIEFDGTAVAATRSTRTWRGFQYINATYTTGGTTEAYKINLKVSGASSVAAGTVYFDDIRVQQTASHGVKAGDGTPTWARRVTIKNGTITQGQAHGDFSHAVSLGGLIPSDSPSFEVADLTITVSGNSSKAVSATFINNGSIHDLDITSTVDTIQSRDSYDGALIYVAYGSEDGSAGSIYNNTINSGIQTGIFVTGSTVAANRPSIYGNSVTLQSKYTNDFALASYGGYGANFYSNTVDCADGNNTCRGIHLESGNGGKIYNNTVSVHYHANNQEYMGCGGAAYGIQIEGSTNTEVYGNTVTANADECESAAFRYYGPESAVAQNNYVHDNTFTALAVNSSTRLASTLRILESYANHLTFSGNTLVTNSNYLFIDGTQTENEDRSLTIDDNTYRTQTPKATAYYPLADVAFADGTGYVPRNITLSNNTYYDATTRADVANAVFKNQRLAYATDTYASNITISQKPGSPEFLPVTTPSVAAGRYATKQSISLSCDAEGTIKYSLDGSAPTLTYSSALTVKPGKTLKYFCDDGVNSETVKSAVYGWPRRWRQ